MSEDESSECSCEGESVLNLPSTKEGVKRKHVFVRLLPLVDGGVPVYTSGFDGYTTYSYPLPDEKAPPKPLKICVDATHTPVQLVDFLIANVAELKHLRPLTADQVLDFIIFQNQQHVSLFGDGSRNEPIDLRKKEYGQAKKRPAWQSFCFLTYPETLERRLLQVVPRDDSKPLLWLDVDGVVNGSVGSDKQQHIKCIGGLRGECLNVLFSPQIVRELNRLATVCDVYWSTMWRQSARFRLAPALGLDDFKVWPGPKGSLEHVVNFDRPLIWIDDELDEHLEIYKDAKSAVKAKFKKHLLLAPVRAGHEWYAVYGLTMRHIEQIDAFLAEHSNRQDSAGDND